MTTLAQLATGNSDKETRMNENLAALWSTAVVFGSRPPGTSGLTWGFYGGEIYVDGTRTTIANGTVALAATSGSTTNYVEVDRAGTVTANTTAFTAGKMPLYEIVTTNATNTITTITDRRAGLFEFDGRVSGISVTTADVTLSAVQSRCRQLAFSGALTASRSVIVPTLVARYLIKNDCTGGTAPSLHKLTIKTAAGTGVEAPRGMCVEVLCNGTDVCAVNASVFPQTLAYAGTLGGHDAANGERVIVGTLTGNIIIPAPTNARIGQSLSYAFTQDGTGGRTITWNAAFKKAADGAGTANQVGCTQFIYEGTNWVQQGGALAWFT